MPRNTALAGRTTLGWNDWTDPIALRERLAEIHTQDCIALSTACTERAIVATLKRMTGLDAEAIRANAREDAETIVAPRMRLRAVSHDRAIR